MLTTTSSSARQLSERQAGLVSWGLRGARRESFACVCTVHERVFCGLFVFGFCFVRRRDATDASAPSTGRYIIFNIASVRSLAAGSRRRLGSSRNVCEEDARGYFGRSAADTQSIPRRRKDDEDQDYDAMMTMLAVASSLSVRAYFVGGEDQ